MNLLDTWLKLDGKFKSAPLFSEHDLLVETFFKGNLIKLKRSPEFDNLMISTVEDGVSSNLWEGLIYIMHWVIDGKIIPLYVGKAERRGVSRDLSFNLANIRQNNYAFGRWGYGLAYHIGDLSHAIFGGVAYKKPAKKYFIWANKLFAQFNPPKLSRKVFVGVISWYKGMKGPSVLSGSVASVEKEIIALAGNYYPDTLMNIDGK